MRLLIIGDSSAAGVGTETQETALSGQLVARLALRYQVTWRLEASTGETTASTIKRLSVLRSEAFDCAVIALGVNDVTHAATKTQFVTQQAALWHLLQDRFQVQQILCSGVPPIQHFPLLPQPLAWVLGRQAARLNRGLSNLAATSTGVTHLPLGLPQNPGMAAPDGFHPSRQAYAIWAANLAQQII